MSVRQAMLALLSEGPRYGLRLREEFEDRTGEVWPLNVGQVYMTLQRLERDGLVESDGSGEDGPAEGVPDHLWWLERLGLAERAAHYPGQLPGGERQRVAIARAMVGERTLLLADEPSGALDSANSEAVMRLLHDACKNGGMTAVVVTHGAQLASWAGRVVFLREGQVTDQTAPAAGPESLLAPGDTR